MMAIGDGILERLFISWLICLLENLHLIIFEMENSSNSSVVFILLFY